MLVIHLKEEGRVRLKVGDVVIWLAAKGRSGSNIALGVEAPPEVSIKREELLPAAEQYVATREGSKS